MYLIRKLTRWRRPAWFDASVLLVVGWAAVVAMSFQVRAGADVVAIAFPPWWTAAQAITAAAGADAAIVRLTALPSVLVVRPAGDDGVARLRQAGAWFAVDPQALAGCLNSGTKEY